MSWCWIRNTLTRIKKMLGRDAKVPKHCASCKGISRCAGVKNTLTGRREDPVDYDSRN